MDLLPLGSVLSTPQHPSDETHSLETPEMGRPALFVHICTFYIDINKEALAEIEVRTRFVWFSFRLSYQEE